VAFNTDLSITLSFQIFSLLVFTDTLVQTIFFSSTFDIYVRLDNLIKRNRSILENFLNKFIFGECISSTHTNYCESIERVLFRQQSIIGIYSKDKDFANKFAAVFRKDLMPEKYKNKVKVLS
jgi:hypothetical protein